MVEMKYERTKKDWFDPKRSLECKMSFEKAFQTEIGIKSKDRFGIKRRDHSRQLQFCYFLRMVSRKIGYLRIYWFSSEYLFNSAIVNWYWYSSSSILFSAFKK